MKKINKELPKTEQSPFLLNDQQKEDTQYKIATPPFYKRMFSALIDIGFFFLLSIGLMTLAYFTVFDALGYEDKIHYVQNMYEESQLFIKTEQGEFLTHIEKYDDKKSPIENFDVPISNFYTSDSRAILDQKYEYYCKSKLDSKLFETSSNGEIVPVVGATYEDLAYFLKGEYEEALKYFYSNPDYILNSKFTYYTLIYTVLIVALISSSIYYLIIPLCLKSKVSLGEMMFKMVLVNKEKQIRANNKNVIIRYLCFASINIFAPILLYTQIPYLALIPLFITILLMAFNKHNFAPHDYVSNTYLGLKYSLLNYEKDSKSFKKDSKKPTYTIPKISDVN